jgi:hypothetical protein
VTLTRAARSSGARAFTYPVKVRKTPVAWPGPPPDVVPACRRVPWAYDHANRRPRSPPFLNSAIFAPPVSAVAML